MLNAHYYALLYIKDVTREKRTIDEKGMERELKI
jgi:hypothetical protein